MILRVSSAAVRGALIVLALGLAASFSYSGIRNTLAQYDVGLGTRAGYERAVRLVPDNAENWYLLGRYWQYNLENPNAERTISAYKEALALDPRDANAWADLATAYEIEGDVSAARKAFEQAKRAYSLSPDVSWRYGNFLLRRGEVRDALGQLKGAVEMEPKRAGAAFSLCMRVEPDIHTVMDDVLPPSPEALMNVIDLLADRDEPDQALVVWNRLTALHAHFMVRDSYKLIELLMNKHRMDDAQSVWKDALAAAAVSRPPDAPGSLVWDGGFESDISGGGLAWRYHPSDGVQVNFDTIEKHSGGRSLRLTFNGLVNSDFHDACQFIAVQPSTSYLLAAWMKTDSLSTDQGVRFRLQPFGGTTNSISWTDDLSGTQPWTQIKRPWSAGSDVHGLELCVIRLPSAKFDSKIHGSAWIDDVTLVPMTPPAGRAVK